MAEKKGYTTGKWNGHTQLQCSDCQYDTLDYDGQAEARMKAHRRSHDRGTTPQDAAAAATTVVTPPAGGNQS